MFGLTRSSNDRIFFGVAGGIAERAGIGSGWVRLAFVLAALASGVGIFVYALLLFVIPPAGWAGAPFLARVRADAFVVQEGVSTFVRSVDQWRLERQVQPGGTRRLVGGTAVGIGIFVLLSSFGLFWWLDFWRVIGLVAVLVGIALLLPARAATPGVVAGPSLVIALIALGGVLVVGVSVEAVRAFSEDDDAAAWSFTVDETQEAAEAARLKLENEQAQRRIEELERRIYVLEAWPNVATLADERAQESPAPR